MFFIQKSRGRISPDVPLPRQNNFLKNKSNIIHQINILILFQLCLGVNRLYLLCERKCVLVFSYIYNMVLVHFTVAFLIFEDITNVSHIILKNAAGIEYMILCLNALILSRKKFKTFFSEWKLFDDLLNIKNNVSEIISKRFILISFGGVVVYHIFYLMLVNYHMEIPNIFYLMYLPLIAHDCEIITLSTFLIMIWRRLQILKAHAAKIFVVNDAIYANSKKLSKVEELAKNINLNVSSLHDSYGLLHKSAVNLNSIISFPLIVIIIKSGLSTVMLLKNLIAMIEGDPSNPLNYGFLLTSTTAVVLLRCLMYTLLISYPCYIATLTKGPVTEIRTTINDFLNMEYCDKEERRKIKSLYQLSRDNKFTYVLGGIMSLEMSLPLTFASLCTSYLIIILQFSKILR